MDPKRHLLFFILAGLFGIAILTPQINFQSAISVGDHGLNYYTFQRIANGDRLYKDFWWGYGPLSPYYYAAFYKFFGETMSSVLLGRMLLVYISGLFCFLTVACFSPPLLALAASIWFWIYNPDFFYSYNHTGAFTIFLALTYFLFSYYKSARPRYIAYSFIVLFLLNMIRINMGLALLAGLIVTAFITDKYIHRKNEYPNLLRNLACGFGICLLSGIIYWSMLSGLPDYAVLQCMPYFSKVYHSASSSIKYVMYFKFLYMITSNSWRYILTFGVIVTAFVLVIRHLLNPQTDKKIKTDILFALGTVSALILLVSHEFIMGYQLYRVNWTIPYQMVLFCLVIGFAVRKYHLNIRYAVILFVLFVALFDSVRYLNRVDQLKAPDQMILLENAQIFVGNQPEWIRTVEQTTHYLEYILEDDETFFALPYEPLYYYLTSRKSPTWHVLMMAGSELNSTQEEEMIETLKDKRIRYVLLSNRYRSKEQDMGELGVTHLKELAKYINAHFQTEATFGFWDADPGWNFNHGLKILKRIEP